MTELYECSEHEFNNFIKEKELVPYVGPTKWGHIDFWMNSEGDIQASKETSSYGPGIVYKTSILSNFPAFSLLTSLFNLKT